MPVSTDGSAIVNLGVQLASGRIDIIYRQMMQSRMLFWNRRSASWLVINAELVSFMQYMHMKGRRDICGCLPNYIGHRRSMVCIAERGLKQSIASLRLWGPNRQRRLWFIDRSMVFFIQLIYNDDSWAALIHPCCAAVYGPL